MNFTRRETVHGIRRAVCSAFLLIGTMPIPGYALLAVERQWTSRVMEPFLWSRGSVEATCDEGREMDSISHYKNL